MAKRMKAPATSVPLTREEAEALAGELATLVRQVEAAEREAAETIQAVKLALKARTAEIHAEARSKFAALMAWANANRDAILPSGRKSLTIAAGTIGWRIGNARVAVEDEAAAIAWCEANEGERFLRVEVGLDKNALLEAALEEVAEIPGIEIVAGRENFFFKPLEVESEMALVVPLARAGKAA
jgi:phage host-nuclease inhibitor protein Gam